ncbi:hypothetical protein ADIMK_1358 [Marinobacterium lacunae]|uniref:Uncharacterized protein n=1 Tax=Marinobacterium lacunae TaxID=1232683 RepID=A0A081G0Z9_9GAMM|nr:hypothetical protein [Marinobacterium lacunae]KEA64454.1 hypothetical protein ADIMK_1358 [Marinobacterium lacunae]
MTSPIHSGVVSWTGDNPGIYLKEQADGPWTGLATYFNIQYSPYGRGRGVLLLEEPDSEVGYPAVCNIMLSDNQDLARYLLDEFFSRFAAFRVSKATPSVAFLELTSAHSEGDTRDSYREYLSGDGLDVVMSWDKLGKPYAVDMPPEKGPTQKHEMYSLFIDAAEAGIEVNGKRLRGSVATRGFDGGTKSSAFLAFSETWIQMPSQ